jgi:hypothetical protein
MRRYFCVGSWGLFLWRMEERAEGLSSLGWEVLRRFEEVNSCVERWVYVKNVLLLFSRVDMFVIG